MFIGWYQVWRFIIRLYILPPGHWTCWFVCISNFTESIQSCSHFGALKSPYTLPSLSYQVLIFIWVKWSIWGLSALPKDTTSKQGPNIESGETWYFSENLAPSGIRNRTAGPEMDKAPRSSYCVIVRNNRLCVPVKRHFGLLCHVPISLLFWPYDWEQLLQFIWRWICWCHLYV